MPGAASFVPTAPPRPSASPAGSIAAAPPFEIEAYSGEAGEELRLRYRYLDLRREPMREAIVLRHRIVAAIREFFDGEGFVDIETPVLTRSTPEGARDF